MVTRVTFSPEEPGLPDVLGSQGHAPHVLIAQPILEGAVEFGGAAMCSQQLEIPDLILPVHQQLSALPVHPDQHAVPHVLLHVAGHQLVGDAISEALAWGGGAQGRVGQGLCSGPCPWLPHLQQGVLICMPSTTMQNPAPPSFRSSALFLMLYPPQCLGEPEF